MNKWSRRIFLSPISLFFYMISELRNFAFDFNFIKISKLPVPVISVGNLSTGGTGKTPFTIALIDLLQTKYNHIAVISRGYGRRSKGSIIVSLRGNIKTDVLEAGDEPFMIANRFSALTVVVAEKRIEGYRLIETENPDLIILDDAFQHRSIARDLDIVLMNGNKPYYKDMLLPSGNLREVIRRLKRADCMVITKMDSVNFVSIPTFKLEQITHEFSTQAKKELNTILVSGIANPVEFEQSILQLGINYRTHLVFNDHYDYKKSDFDSIDVQDQIITTEKDFYKIKPYLKSNILLFLQQNYHIGTDLKSFILNKM